jgi:hypothetical protein
MLLHFISNDVIDLKSLARRAAKKTYPEEPFVLVVD